MENYVDILKRTKLFSGIKENEITSIIGCLNARIKKYKKGEYIFCQGDKISDIMILLQGKLHIQREDYWGNSNLLSTVDVGEMFGESYVSTESPPIMNDIVAVEDSTVMFFCAKRIVTACSSACRFHSAVVQNLFFAISDKNRQLVQKLGHMSKRTTREKLMSYLSEEARRQKSTCFTIPFNRQQLANYLSVDRSAMSNELSKMRDEGLIRFEKSKFELI